jgi:hypothetical protein
MASIFHQSDVNMCMAYPGLTLTHILPDGSKVIMAYQPHEHVQQEQVELLDLVNEPIALVEPASVVEPATVVEPKVKRVRRKNDPGFNALTDDEKKTKLRDEVRSPIDVSKEAIVYLNSLGGNGHNSARNVFINTMHQLTRDQKNCLMTNIRQYELSRSKKVADGVKELVNRA